MSFKMCVLLTKGIQILFTAISGALAEIWWWASVFGSFSTDSTNSGENMYTMINAVPPGGNRQNVRQHDKFTIFAHMHLSSYQVAFIPTVLNDWLSDL